MQYDCFVEAMEINDGIMILPLCKEIVKLHIVFFLTFYKN